MQQLTPYLDQGFLEQQIEEYHRLMAEFIADFGVSFHCVKKPSFYRFLKFVRETAADNIPGRRRLVNIIEDLARESRLPRLKVFEEHVANGRIVSIIMDGWEASLMGYITDLALHLKRVGLGMILAEKKTNCLFVC